MSKQTFKLLNVDRGTCASYLALTFDDMHFTQTRVAVYSAITDLVLNIETSETETLKRNRTQDFIEKERESLYERVNREMCGSITTNDIENLYNTSVCVLVRSYENVQVKFNEIKSQSWAELTKSGIDSKLLVCFSYYIYSISMI